MTRKPLDSLNTKDIDLKGYQSDEEIFRSFTLGDVAALGKMYDRYGLLVYRVIYRMLNNTQESEDLTQEIFLSLQEKPRFDPQRGSFYTYLMTLTRSRAIDRLRSRRSQGRFWQDIGKLKDSMGQREYCSPLDTLFYTEKIAKVKKALENLSPQQRQVLELSYFEGLSQSEIAKRLNMPLGTVKTHSRRGLLQLKQNLHNFHLI